MDNEYFFTIRITIKKQKQSQFNLLILNKLILKINDKKINKDNEI